jgi:quercetin dioxygenase-like cupin family protein
VDGVPGFDGVKLAVGDGNPAKGPAHFFMKFAPGFSGPQHVHDANHYVVVLAGTMVLGAGGKAVRPPIGSCVSFTGKKAHSTNCDAGAECMLFVDARSKWDVVPVKAGWPRPCAPPLRTLRPRTDREEAGVPVDGVDP